jgi:hypothetical protein
MDTVRLKTQFNMPPNSPYFSEQVKARDLGLHTSIGGSRFVYSNQTWRKERKLRGLYTPKYWIEQDYINPNITFLIIEFSAPKLLFGENLTALREEHFPAVVEKLQDFLKEISIYMTKIQIENLTPIVLAVGRNLNITDVCSCDIAMQALSPFNNRFRSESRLIQFEGNLGREMYFNNKSTTFKIYEKIPEMIANATTKEERKLVDAWVAYSKSKYGKKKVFAIKILRLELTLKTKVAIKQVLKKYTTTPPTFKSIFNEKMWAELVRKEVDEIYNQPINDFIFLATNQEPVISAFLDKNYKHIPSKDMARGILQSLQGKGLAKTKRYYMQNYSRQTWYNYMKRLGKLAKITDFSSINNVTAVEIHRHILKEFQINASTQIKLNL